MDVRIVDFGARPDAPELQTAAIQAALDAVGKGGGGTVRVPRGVFRTGGLQLRSRTALKLEEGAVLRGSEDPFDYGGKAEWGDSLLRGDDLVDVTLEGPGTLDGADCRNPKGEEGFRGPHAIWLEQCRKLTVRDLHIERSANWAFHCVRCEDAQFDRVTVRGGHDGFHASSSLRFAFRDCDLRSGDDCIAGADNADFTFDRCRFNTSCNAFRFACRKLRVRDCRIWGPGEAEHKVSGRNNLLHAFVHFSPTDRGYAGTVPHSYDWVVERLEVDRAESLYAYDYPEGLWQTGRPVANVLFREVKARNLLRGIRAIGDAARQLSLRLERVELGFEPGREAQIHVEARSFAALELQDVTLETPGEPVAVRASQGGRVLLERVRDRRGQAATHELTEIDRISA